MSSFSLRVGWVNVWVDKCLVGKCPYSAKHILAINCLFKTDNVGQSTCYLNR